MERNDSTATGEERVVIDEERVVIWEPVWAGEIEGWTVKHIMKNEWKVLPELGYDDLYQDAHVCFNYLRRKYPRVVEPAHFMALYKTSFSRIVIDHANRRTAQHRISSSIDGNKIVAETSKNRTTGGLDKAEMALMLGELSGPLAQLVAQLVVKGDQPAMLKRGAERETLEDYLCRIAGIEPGFPVVERVLEWIKEGTICVFPRPVNSTSVPATV